jgi:hypothetical protein
MKTSIISEDFYVNLNSIVKTKIQDIYKAQRLCELLSIVSIIFYLVICFIFIFLLKDIFFKPNYFFDLNLLFDFCKILITLSGAIFITSYINKIPTDNYKKTLNSLKELLILDVCTCNSKCNCKISVIIYLKKQGITVLS